MMKTSVKTWAIAVMTGTLLMAGSNNSWGQTTGNVGINETNPASRLSVNGNMAIGSGYSNVQAPANGLIIQGNVGIGTNNPAYQLDVNGSMHVAGELRVGSYSLPMSDGIANQVLTTNGTGEISWQTISSSVGGSGSGWSLTGNAGTNPSTNFIGTTDNQSLVFKANNQLAGKIDLSLNNALFGYQAGSSVTTGTNNTAIGTGAMKSSTSGKANVALGSAAMYLNTTGNNNTVVGTYGLQKNTTGSSNSVLGYSALNNNTTGNGNTAIGAAAMQNNSTGLNNTAVGNGAMQLCGTGNANVTVGSFSMTHNTDGSNNVAMGYSALSTLTSGDKNTAIGNSSGITITTGSKNTFVGTDADATSATISNATAIGSNAKVSASNSMVLGGTGFYAVNVGIGTTAPNSTLQINGSFSTAIVTQTANYTATGNDHTILCNNTSGTITIGLPTASSSTGRMYIIKKISPSGSNSVVVDPNGSETIEGAINYTLNNQNSAITIQSDGTGWYVVTQM